MQTRSVALREGVGSNNVSFVIDFFFGCMLQVLWKPDPTKLAASFVEIKEVTRCPKTCSKFCGSVFSRKTNP